MRIEFKELRESVRCIDVLVLRGIKLREKMGSDYSSGPCPLPCHPQERNNAFAVHRPSNRWQCKDKACGKLNGVGDLWGDCINLVACLDGIGLKDAASKLAELLKQKPAIPKNSGPTEARGQHQSASSPAAILESKTSSDSGKGYVHEVGVWLDEVLDMEDRGALKRLLVTKIMESYKNGRTAKR